MQRKKSNTNRQSEIIDKPLTIENMPNEVVYQILSYLPDEDIKQIVLSTSFLNARGFEYLSLNVEALSAEQLTAFLAKTNNVTTINPMVVLEAIRYWDKKTKFYKTYHENSGHCEINNFLNMKITLAIILFHRLNQCDDNNYKAFLNTLNEKIKLIYNNTEMTIYKLFNIEEEISSSRKVLLQRLIDVFVHILKRRDELFINDHDKLPIYLNLSGINLRGQRLPNIKLSNTNLSFADLENADLVGATLIDTILYKTNLSNVNLKGATITHFENFDFTKTNIFITYPLTPVQWYLPHMLPPSVFNTNSNNALTNALNKIYENQILTLDKNERNRIQGYIRRFIALYIMHSIKDKDNVSALSLIDEMKKSKLFHSLFAHRTIKKFKLKLFNENGDFHNGECIKEVEKFTQERSPKKEPN